MTLRILPPQSDMQEPAVDFPRGGFLVGAAALNSCRSVLQQLGEQQKVACECLHKSTRIDPHKT